MSAQQHLHASLRQPVPGMSVTLSQPAAAPSRVPRWVPNALDSTGLHMTHRNPLWTEPLRIGLGRTHRTFLYELLIRRFWVQVPGGAHRITPGQPGCRGFPGQRQKGPKAPKVPRWVPTARDRFFTLPDEAVHGTQTLPHSRSSATAFEVSPDPYSLSMSLGFCASYHLLRSPRLGFVTTKPRNLRITRSTCAVTLTDRHAP